ncbi:OmpA family protein [Lutibacter sp.]|uniref:OmpA family protein n=1 Tax=Lutibacter sp. TaxID=1925666 RepID=UPI0025C43419|nr:OmpA family protein [Lutibacter sp.]MCF6182502.1 OmpA family protein [Lutibacter sp.]
MKKITLIIILFAIAFTNAQDLKYKIKNSVVNTKYSDFGVSFYGENTVVFASARKDKSIIRRGVWLVNKEPYLELFKGTFGNDEEISNVQLFSKTLNSKFHDADVVFTKDLKTIYFSRNNFLNKKFKKDSTGVNLIQLYKAQMGENGEWGNIEAMPFNSDNYQTGHPALNKEGDTLYFISDMPSSLGLTDIYKVAIHKDGTYGTPKNLGPEINTAKSEMFPFIDENNVLYFSSNGYSDAMGGLDIYATKLRKNNTYYVPINLGQPINSVSDDFGYVKQNGKNTGFLSSNREGGKGDDDIYSFEELTPLKFNCNEVVTGVVKEKGTGKLISGALILLYDSNGNKKESIIANENATFKFNIVCDESFKISASKESYKEFLEDFSSNNPTNLELTLETLPKKSNEFIEVRGKLMVNINPIYFDYNKSNIRKDATSELDKVVEIMRKYPSIKIEAGSHTDSRGNSNYNQKLSTKRAVATITYIISKGINKNRLIAKGFGETQLVNKCSNGVKCTEAEHQMNRRTEFVIVNPKAINQILNLHLAYLQ